eukprot:TRINITY_DN8120_c1_g2_i1.p2 TRINITY_DN8120_c1_g2~~TRINITY_DN8120_c1_g2_i1.p2  ORF type:complete len:268 (+),score=15.52 TRINITY_DN8120_c1_g2_i1:245-1048(+)
MSPRDTPAACRPATRTNAPFQNDCGCRCYRAHAMIPRGRRRRADVCPPPPVPPPRTRTPGGARYAEPAAKRICRLGAAAAREVRPPAPRRRAALERLCYDLLVAVLVYVPFTPRAYGRLMRACQRLCGAVSSDAYWKGLLRVKRERHAAATFALPSPLADLARAATARTVVMYQLIKAGRCCVCFQGSPAPKVFALPFEIVFCPHCAEVYLVRAPARAGTSRVVLRQSARGAGFVLDTAVPVARRRGFDPLGLLAVLTRPPRGLPRP